MFRPESARNGHPVSSPTTRSVAVVDPQAGDYSGWAELAEAAGIRLRIVSSAAEALRLARAESIDLWVVNTRLPGLSGCELAGMLKSRRHSAAVYLVADEVSPDEERRAFAARATMFGYKPGHADWLHQWISSSQERTHENQQPELVALVTTAQRP